MTSSVTVRLRTPNGQPHYVSTPEFAQYIDETYIKTGRMSVSHNLNTETSTLATTLRFASAADKSAYFNDPQIVDNLERRRVYNIENGIEFLDTTSV